VKAPRVHLTIDRVVLRGLPPDQCEACLRAIQDQLAERFADAEFVRSLRDLYLPAARPDARALGAAGDSPAARVAAGVAASVRSGS